MPSEFEYSPKWYADKAQAGWLSRIKTAADLIKREHMPIREKKLDHLATVYGGRQLEGHGLEVCFGCGNGMYWLARVMKGVTFDAFDWNPALSKLIPYLRDIHGPRLRDIWIGDETTLQQCRDGYYEWANCIDVFEHLSEDVYWRMLGHLYRILKPGGLCGVYVGRARDVRQHIRIVPVKQTRQEMCRAGFRSITNNLFRKPEK